MQGGYAWMKRLCIYLTYDKYGIVDKYIGYMLKELKTCVNYLVVVCNQLEIVCGMDILEKYADEIHYRENIGYDTGGFKDALCDLIGWKRVLQYDELVLVNDSMFGPFRTMKAIFDEMTEKQVDFWGLAKHGEGNNNEINYFPKHIQTYFLTIRSKMLHSHEFREYWEIMPYYTSFIENVRQHEVRFTHYFWSLGYTYSTLANTEINDSTHINNNYMQYGRIAYELIKKRNFPFLKRQQIVYNTLDQQTQENLKKAIDYIDKETEYDVNLIWDNIIRNFDMADLQRSLHLQYIFTSKQKENISGSIMILIFITHRNSLEYVLEYVQNVKLVYPVKIVADNDACLEDYRKRGIECKKVKRDETWYFIADFCEFDYVCVLHDVDMTSDMQPSCVGKSYFYNIWENLFKDKNYISNIIKQFNNESRLGFLTSPQPNFAGYFGEYGKKWDGSFEEVYRIKKSLCLNSQISEYKAPFRITDNFWIRGCILKKLRDIEKKDFQYLPYLWSYLAQDSGYYVGIVESAEYSSMNEVNLQHYLSETAFCIRQRYGGFENFSEMKERVYLGSIKKFCERYKKLLIYGVGEIAMKYKYLFPNIEAYVVTDGQKKPESVDGIPVKYLSDINISDDCGIILCLNEKNQKQVRPLLEEKGIKHYYCI